ncbi:MAG TPA: HAD-IA family hydrolase [Candidatus Limnocylindrales bacterium]|nr:HAD-IA family hydrolase [Candidatus Limnocylindrales bacterium]
MRVRWATFDCYGTLVDWMGGIRATLASLWPDADADALLAAYHRHEPLIQAGAALPYRQVMAEVLSLVASEAGLTVPTGRDGSLGGSLPGWAVFPEVPTALAELRRRGWRLAVLSNTDPDLLDASLTAIGVPVDERVAASEIGSYKPAPGHWQTFFARTGADPARHVHVAASLFHDIEPCSRMRMRCVWINREAEASDLPRDGELTDLAGLPDLLDGLVPG